MAKINGNKLGLVLGTFFALLHVIWALIIAVGYGEQLIEWILPLHFIDILVGVTAFSIMNALILVVMAFIGGYIIGWLYAWIWNMFNKR